MDALQFIHEMQDQIERYVFHVKEAVVQRYSVKKVLL